VKTVEQLAEDFDDVICGAGQVPRPSEWSIRKINAHFNFVLPDDLITFAKHARFYGRRFASLGDDYDSPSHIIRINSYWRRRRQKRAVPRNLVAINRGFDDDLDCLDISSIDAATGEYAVQYWFPGIDESDASRSRYGSFREYIESQVRAWSQDKNKK
jgi:hypothetical protein